MIATDLTDRRARSPRFLQAVRYAAVAADPSRSPSSPRPARRLTGRHAACPVVTSHPAGAAHQPLAPRPGVHMRASRPRTDPVDPQASLGRLPHVLSSRQPQQPYGDAAASHLWVKREETLGGSRSAAAATRRGDIARADLEAAQALTSGHELADKRDRGATSSTERAISRSPVRQPSARANWSY
jgi:hypothetical protein